MKAAFKRILCAVLLFSTLLITPTFATEEGCAGEVAADRLLGFADSLFGEGDYYRAITEYKRFLFHYPAEKRAETALFRIAESCFKARRWQEAIDAVGTFMEKYPAGRLIHEAHILKGLCERNLKRYEDALRSFDRVLETTAASDDARQRALYESALVHVDREDWDRAKESFSKIPDGSTLHPSALRFSSGLSRIHELPQKSPAAAGTLAAIIPGSGHVYAERYRDGLVAFLLNGAFILAAVEFFRNDHDIAGGIAAFFEAGFYAGNIYSAVSSAHKFNRREREEYLRKLKDESPLSLRFDHGKSASYIMYSIRY